VVPLRLFPPVFSLEIVGENRPAVLVVVAVDAEVFPVAPVRGIVVVIAVPMMDGEKPEVVLVELATAFGADPAVELKRPLPIVLPLCL